jgi:hypothetical protein
MCRKRRAIRVVQVSRLHDKYPASKFIQNVTFQLSKHFISVYDTTLSVEGTCNRCRWHKRQSEGFCSRDKLTCTGSDIWEFGPAKKLVICFGFYGRNVFSPSKFTAILNVHGDVTKAQHSMSEHGAEFGYGKMIMMAPVAPPHQRRI